MPEKFYYVPLPRLPRVRITVVRERLRMLDFRFRAGTRRGHRNGRRGRKVLRRWVVAHSRDAVLWTLALALAVALGVLAAIV
jgi:hypothetical protein